MAAINYKDMTPEQKLAAYDKLMGKREDRKGNSKAIRAAKAELVKNHQAEFDKLCVKHGAKVAKK